MQLKFGLGLSRGFRRPQQAALIKWEIHPVTKLEVQCVPFEGAPGFNILTAEEFGFVAAKVMLPASVNSHAIVVRSRTR